MHLFYDSEINKNSILHQLKSDETHHALRVLRLKVGDTVFVINGMGSMFTCTIENIEKRGCYLKIEEEKVVERNGGEKTLHLAIAPPKKKERFEWLLEKCTELGIKEITPLLCERSERKSINTQRLDKILVSAMKQSIRSFLPKLNQLTKLTEFIGQNKDSEKYIAHCDNFKKSPFQDIVNFNKNQIVLIGPEGDFSPNEINNTIANNYIPVDLGAYRLRTETAGISVCSIINFH